MWVRFSRWTASYRDIALQKKKNPPSTTRKTLLFSTVMAHPTHVAHPSSTHSNPKNERRTAYSHHDRPNNFNKWHTVLVFWLSSHRYSTCRDAKRPKATSNFQCTVESYFSGDETRHHTRTQQARSKNKNEKHNTANCLLLCCFVFLKTSHSLFCLFVVCFIYMYVWYTHFG